MIQLPRPNPEQLFHTPTIFGLAVAKDETRIAVATNFSGRYDAWGIDLDCPFPYRLTNEGQVPYAMHFDPQGRYVLVAFDHDGDENAQLYLIPPRGGEKQPLCTHEGRRLMFCTTSKDGNRIYYSSDKDNPTYLCGYVFDLESGEEKTLYQGEGGPTVLVAVSDDETSWVTATSFANTYQIAHLHRGGERVSLTPDPGTPHIVESIEFAGHLVVFATDYQADELYLASFDPQTGSFQRIWAPEKGSVTHVAVHEDSQTAYAAVMRGVIDELYRVDLRTGSAEKLSAPCDVVGQIKVGDSGRLYLLGGSDNEPGNVWMLDLDGTWRPLTRVRPMGFSPDDLVQADVVHFPSFDGLTLEALLFRPKPEVANGYTIVWPHGGPQAAERKGFRKLFQYWLLFGYQVFAPNFRGSTGYGSRFMKMVERDWGEGPRKDMIASIEWLVAQGLADRDKLFLVGGSYGGYMTLLLHGRHADYFRACVDLFGPSNLVTFAQSVPDFWKPIMKMWLGDPDDPADRERLIKDSPITYLDGMTKPMLVIQGANDPRVVKAESDQIVQALREKGRDVEYIVFQDEGHGFMKLENEIEAYRRTIAFLDRHRHASTP
ncbi:alpha/beta fold hydrolase [Alicyclobacillus mali (ex Roth et al. 2021)]|uniref:alpha/beta fold hydrolase n=1 Tax=Alicyclobacillus mali (ex Roth et al. 2021) TaxID=1123961 RepID=UPI001A8CD92E